MKIRNHKAQPSAKLLSKGREGGVFACNRTRALPQLLFQYMTHWAQASGARCQIPRFFNLKTRLLIPVFGAENIIVAISRGDLEISTQRSGKGPARNGIFWRWVPSVAVPGRSKCRRTGRMATLATLTQFPWGQLSSPNFPCNAG